MQTVASGWTTEERDTVRQIASNLQISWEKESLLANRLFTIGVSLIGGNDIIGINPGAIGSPGNYRYFDESDYVTSLAWERGFRMPIGGITKALAEAKLDNTSGRFTPRYMGGTSELFTAILPRRPTIINAGFNYGGIDQTIPVFAGQITKQPGVDKRNGEVDLQMADYVGFFEDRTVDKTAIYTSVTTDTIIENLLIDQGMSTAQYDLDPGINVIPFALFEKGQKLSNAINKLVEAENGHMYQDESGIFKFENRQHWDSSPYTEVQRVITTAQVLNAEQPSEDHIINVVEIKSKVRQKAIQQKLWSLSSAMLIPANGTLEIFADFTDDYGAVPVLQITVPTYSATVTPTSFYSTNTIDDGTGSANNSAISIKNYSQFATSYKITFQNTSSQNTYITAFDIWGRPAKVTSEIYTKKQRDASVTAYEEKTLTIDDNPFIQNQDWADSFAELLLEDFAEIENLQTISIRALPELALGDLISWQGRYFRIFNIRTKLDPGEGFIQELKLVQRSINSYIRIGISSIGGSDKIAP